MARSQKDAIFDTALVMKDAGLVAASAAAQVGGVNKILDLGALGRADGRVVVDISAIEIASADEIYNIVFQVSSSATFASVIKNIAGLNIGATAVAHGGADDGVIGHYELPVTNEYNGTVYRYARLYTVCGGTIATGINYTAFLAPQA